MKILIINGPNLNLLGVREPEIYGKEDYGALCAFIEKACRDAGADFEIYQSNHEGDIVDKIQSAYKKFNGIVINPAAYTHTSIAIPDAIAAVGIPTVEVHLTDITKREEFRKISHTSPVCIKTLMGKGFAGYKEAVEVLAEYIK